MGTLASRSFTAAAVALTIFACGDEDESAGSGPPTDATMTAISSTICQKYSECTSEFVLQIAYGTADGCTARGKQQFNLDIKANGYSVTDANANACLAAVKSLSCADLLDNRLPDACHFKGALADGSNCTTDSQCASGSCFVDDTATCGKCGPRAALGASCTNSNCEYGLRCNATKLCTDGSLGASCAADSDCHAFSLCRGGVCTALLEESAACVTNPGNKEPPCNILKGLFCSPASLLDPNGTCKKGTVKLVANGEKCGVLSLVPVEFGACTNGECIEDRCQAHIADGAACTGVDKQPKCQEPAKCRAGTCALKDPVVCK